MSNTEINDYKFHTLEDMDGVGTLAISTSLEEGRTTLSVHEAPGGVVMVKIDDLLEILGGKAEAETAERPEWLEAEVIRAELDGEFVFAVRDEDNDWLLYGGKCDGDYVVDGEAEDEFSNVEIVKA